MEDFLGSIPQSNFHCIWCRGGANYLYSHAGEFFHFLAISTIWYIFWALAISTAYGGEVVQTIYIHTLVSFFHFLANSTIWYIFWALAISTAYSGEALQTIYIHTLVSPKEVRGGNALNSSVPTLVFD